MSRPGTRLCVYCGKPIVEDKPTRRLYCSDAHKVRDCRRRKSTPRSRPQPGPYRNDGTYRPRNLYFAEQALRKGVPLRSLILGDDEHAVLVAACDRFSSEQRMEAVEHLAELFSWAGTDGDELGLQATILIGLKDCWEECPIFFVPRSGVRSRWSSWIPARWHWCLTLNAFLPWYLKTFHLPAGYWGKSRGGVSAWRQPRQVLRCPSDSEALMETIRRQIPSALAQRDHEGVMQVQTSTRAQDETLLRLARVEMMTREILDHVRALPSEAEVEEAVDQFLDDVGVKTFAEEIGDLP